MQTLQAGANTPLNTLETTVSIFWSTPAVPEGQIDISAFLLGADEKVRSDADFIFYNQPALPGGQVKLLEQQKTPDGSTQNFVLQLGSIPDDIAKIAFTIVIHSEQSFSVAQALKITVGAEAEFTPATQGMQEKALILGQLYRHQGDWKFRALGQGFNGGLAPLATHFGVDVDDEPNTPTSPPAQSPAQSHAASASAAAGAPASTDKSPAIDLEKRLEAKAPRLISLAKPIKISLEKKNLTQVRARVAFVLDASGSMSYQFSSGNVQAVLDRIAALAVQFDDDQALELWAFADKCKKYDDVSLDNLDDYVKNLTKKEKKGLFGGIGFSIIKGLGVGNNEPPVIRDIIDTYKNSDLPAYVIFITDGGIYKDGEIKTLLKEAANYPIFWQYVGLGGRNYGILEQLDDLPGRVVDNADFFPIDDFKKIQDSELYDRLLNEFPGWLKAAKAAGILR